MAKTQFPIAEIFCSPQGEGTHTGTLMIFLRLAGCTVGTRYPKEAYRTSVEPFKIIFPEYTNECHLYDGRTFPCDTNYTKKASYTEDELLAVLQGVHPTCPNICLTGGEPLMHKNIDRLVDALTSYGYKIFIETSGTIPFEGEDNKPARWALHQATHVSISPKLGFRDAYLIHYKVKDIKLLIDEKFTLAQLPVSLQKLFTSDCSEYNATPPFIFLQPVNGEHTINEQNLARCLNYQVQFPHLKISTQAHKFWSVR